MPVLKIGLPKPLPASSGLPEVLAERTLRLNAAHLKPETESYLNALAIDADTAPPAPDGLLVYIESRENAWMSRASLVMDFRNMQDPCQNIMLLPADLRECVIYAASCGFTGLAFEHACQEDVPLCKVLPVYQPD